MQQMIRLAEEREKFRKMLSEQERFIYLQCLNQEEISVINKLAAGKKIELNNIKLYCGIPAASVDREGFYRMASRIKSCLFTFRGLWDGKNINAVYCEQKDSKNKIVYISDSSGASSEYQLPDEITIADLPVKGEAERRKSAGLLKDRLDSPNTICFLNIKENFHLWLDIFLELYSNCIWIDCRKPEESQEDRTGKERLTWRLSEEDLSVAVVCTLYKRPDNLLKQFKAIQEQTLKPAEILLFQDGIQGEYQIRLTDSLKSQFSQVRICSVNEGVWGRFRYAQTASSKYICIFDDDTIPGSRWLENCHYNMLKREGVYGTIGILFHECEHYPYSGYCRVGWANPEEEVCRVDFTGHSWFFKKKYLNWMFEGTEKYQALKYAAEDMCLSVKCQEHGINTFIPEHPRHNRELWGSLPEYGERLGISGAALSLNRENHLRMQNAVKDLVKEGWKLCYMEDAAYVKKIIRRQKRRKVISVPSHIRDRILERIDRSRSWRIRRNKAGQKKDNI